MRRLCGSEVLLTADDFAAYVGQAFRADATPAAVDLHLDRIERHAFHPVHLREPFTLIFSTHLSALLTAGCYRLRAADGWVVGIDLIPTQTAPGPRRTYHAVFT